MRIVGVVLSHFRIGQSSVRVESLQRTVYVYILKKNNLDRHTVDAFETKLKIKCSRVSFAGIIDVAGWIGSEVWNQRWANIVCRQPLCIGHPADARCSYNILRDIGSAISTSFRKLIHWDDVDAIPSDGRIIGIYSDHDPFAGGIDQFDLNGSHSLLSKQSKENECGRN